MLIYDDDPDSAEMYTIGLQLQGLPALRAASRDEAADVASGSLIAAVVADARTVVTRGWPFGSEAPLADPPVVLLTAGRGAWVDEVAQSTCSAVVLTKPCLPDTLASVVRTVVGPRSSVVLPFATWGRDARHDEHEP